VFGSRYGFGNAYFEVDDLGVYLSSVAVTVLMACMATIGIILFSLVVTLVVMLGKCQNSPLPNSCAGFTLNAEVKQSAGLPSATGMRRLCCNLRHLWPVLHRHRPLSKLPEPT
jgi:hypothetical protein